MEQTLQETIESPKACGCEGKDPCEHDAAREMAAWNDEVALAFLVALTPLAVLTLFGQIGLL